MFKRIFSLTLALLICCTASITVFSQAEHSHAGENDVSDVDEAAQGINASSTSSGSATGDVKIDSEYIRTGTADPEYWEWLNGAPDEVLSGSTAEVLEYFLNSNFLGQQVLSCSSTPRKTEIDFSCHEAFREFISREDCIEVLESYAGSLLSSLESDELDIAEFEKLLEQSSIKSLISDLPSIATSCPNLQSMYTASEAATASVGDYVGTVNGIDYYSAGTISTANGRSVEVCTPERELTSSEITNYNNKYSYSGNIRLSEPTAVYNCHSYAWYKCSSNNPYWIMNIGQFLNDSGCTQLGSTDTVQVNDIIVYVDADGYVLHSGAVYGVSSSGGLTICSKWGPAGLYIHPVDSIPEEYYSDYDAGEYRYAIFRYHDYENEYTGNEYHSGGRHYFEYADVCQICNKQINTTWTSVICSGPPCAIITAEHKIS